jgi:cytochrome c-type biogenesis protein
MLGIGSVDPSTLSNWWAPALAFAAGVVSFASPCVFPLVPGYLSFIAGGEAKDETKPIVPMLLFVGGFATVFVAAGAFASALRQPLGSELGIRIAGAVILAFGVMMILYAFRLGMPALYAEKRPFLERVRPGKTGAYPLGMAFAVGWTPCIGPVLGAILTLAANQGGAVQGAVLLLFYSAGLGVPFILVGLGVRKLMASLNWVQRNYHWITGVSGAIMVVIGVLMVSGAWYRFLSPILNQLQNIRTPI